MQKKPVIVFSEYDIASSNAYRFFSGIDIQDENVVSLYEEEDRIVHLISEDLLFYEMPQKIKKKAEYVIFVSRHSSASGIPGFHSHTTGNWTEFVRGGGEPETVSLSSGALLAASLLSLWKSCQDHECTNNYQVSLEITHHGPTSLSVPSVFMELGSEKKSWSSKIGGKILANAVNNVIETFDLDPNEEQLLGLGGNHYASKFTKMIHAEERSVAHIAPKYHLDEISTDLLLTIQEKIYGKANYRWIIDKKGTSSPQKRRLTELASENNIEWTFL